MDHHCPDGECWRQIPRAPRYSVSCIGRVRNDETGRVLRPSVQRRHGYHMVHPTIGGVHLSCYAHRLVYEAFVGPIPHGLHVRHLNDVPGDNRLSNLEAGTAKQNSDDRIRLGTHGRKLGEAEAREILAMRATGATQDAIGARFGVTRQTVSHICTGLRWAHLQPAATATP